MIKIRYNSDENLVKEIMQKVKDNNGHCACAISFNEDNKCMCKEFKQQVKDGVVGECHCGLFVAIEE